MKRFGKIVTFGLLGLIVGVILLIVGVQLFFPFDELRDYAIAEGSRTLGRDITIEEADITIWRGPGVELQRVTVSNPPGWNDEPPVLAADMVAVRLRFWPLLIGRLRFSELVLSEPTISLARRDDGTDNFTFTPIAAPEGSSSGDADTAFTAPPQAAVVAFDRVRIENGSIDYRSATDSMSIMTDSINLATTLSIADRDRYGSEGTLEVAQLSVASTDSTTFPPIELRYRATYDLTSQVVTVDFADTRLAQLLISVSGIITDPLESPTARLQLQTNDVAAADLLSLLPPRMQDGLQSTVVSGQLSLNGEVVYLAGSTPSLDYSGTAELRNAELSRSDVSGSLSAERVLVDVRTDNAKVTLFGATFADRPVKALVVVDDFADPVVTAEVSGAVDIGLIQPFFPPEIVTAASGVATVSLTANGRLSSVDDVEFTGSVKVDRAAVRSPLLPAPIESMTVDAFLSRRVVTINALSARIARSEMSFAGRVNDLMPWLLSDSVSGATMSVDVDGNLTGTLDLALANRYLPERGSPAMTGLAQLRLTINGPLNRPVELLPRGRLLIDGATYTDSLLPEPIESLSGELSLSPDTVRVRNLRLDFETSALTLSGSLLRPFPALLPFADSLTRASAPTPYLIFTLGGSRFDVDRLFPRAAPGADTVVIGRQDSVSVLFLPDIDGQGSFAFDTVIYARVPFQELRGNVTIRDRVIDCYQVEGFAYNGAISGRTEIDLTDPADPRYTGEFAADSIEANRFLTRFTPFADHLFGHLNVSGTYDAAGWDAESFLTSLSMTGEGLLSEGSVRFTGVLAERLDQLASVVNVDNWRADQTLRSLVAPIRVEDGRVMVDQLTAYLGELGSVTLNGFYGFDRMLSYDGGVTLSPQVTQRLLGTGAEPLTVLITTTGSLANPTVTIDLERLGAEIVERKAREEAEGLLEEGKGILKDLLDR